MHYVTAFINFDVKADAPFHHRIQRRLFSWAWHWILTETASTNGTESPKTKTLMSRSAESSLNRLLRTYSVLSGSYRSLVGVNKEDLDDDLELPPTRLCNLIWRLRHH